MALSDDINALPDTIADGNTGHTGNHQTIHASLKDHQDRIARTEERIPEDLGLTVDTTVGTRVMAGSTRIYGETKFINVTSLLDPQPNYGRLWVKRDNGDVVLAFEALDYSSGVVATAQLPVGWRPNYNHSDQLTNTLGRVCARLNVTFGGSLKFWSDDSDISPSTNIAMPASPEWPATLDVGA